MTSAQREQWLQRILTQTAQFTGGALSLEWPNTVETMNLDIMIREMPDGIKVSLGKVGEDAFEPIVSDDMPMSFSSFENADIVAARIADAAMHFEGDA